MCSFKVEGSPLYLDTIFLNSYIDPIQCKLDKGFCERGTLSTNLNVR